MDVYIWNYATAGDLDCLRDDGVSDMGLDELSSPNVAGVALTLNEEALKKQAKDEWDYLAQPETKEVADPFGWLRVAHRRVASRSE